jgi:hypothetical protein
LHTRITIPLAAGSALYALQNVFHMLSSKKTPAGNKNIAFYWWIPAIHLCSCCNTLPYSKSAHNT